MVDGITVFTNLKNRYLVNSYSFNFCALTLKTLHDDQLSDLGNLAKVQEFIKENFDSIPWLADRHVPLIGIGGSARNLAQIDQNEKSYPMAGLHQYEMNIDDINRIFNDLKSMSLKRREKVERSE